jgi:protein-S-isoprenylcysteine O-methyltransferase Ste14
MIPAPAAEENAPPAGRGVQALALPAAAVGLAGVAALGAFVLLVGTGWWPRGAPAAGATPWLIDTAWLAGFALQHTGMARRPVKDWLGRVLPPLLVQPCYVAASGLLTLAVLFVWQPLPGEPLWHGPPWVVGISLAAAIATGLHCRRFDQAGLLGLRQVGLWGDPKRAEELRTDGAYRWVRHPQMLGVLLFLWAQPIMPPELFLLDAGLTVYILVAIRFEERDLARQFGPAYVAYRQRVPALIPWRGPAIL